MDTNVDHKLDELGRYRAPGGTAALANARAAYRRFKEIFDGPRWEGLRHGGGVVQRPLWASTSTKDPRYPDTMYVDELVGPHVVNTMPLADAARGRRPWARAGPDRRARSHRRCSLPSREAGIDMRRVTDELLVDGIKQFEHAFRQLLLGIEARRRDMR